jgi:hypothetical protein
MMPTGIKGKPSKSGSSGLGQLINERAALPEGHPAITMYDEAIKKASTHAPASQMINYGSPVAGERDGQPVYFQPSRTGGAPAIIEGITPPRKDKGQALPASALKMQQEQLDAIATAAGIQADLGGLQKQIESGTLKFGPIENLKNQGLNATGMSTTESRAFGSFMSSLEKLRNDSLRLNAGVQTDGDAQRAWNELFANINDTELVKNRLAEIQRINERAVNIRTMNVDTIRQNFGADPLDTSGYQTQESVIKGTKPKGSTLTRGEILNVELQDAIAAGDTQNANLIRQEMKRMGVKESGSGNKPAQSFSLPPNAKQYEGKIIRDTKTNKRYQSKGGRWVEVK